MQTNLVHIRVWGDYACFTRPEMKVERVSYPVMTPSAARGVLEAVFWKPEMYYLIDTIRVVKRGVWTSFRRNEVTKRISLSQAKTAMQGGGEISLIQAGGGASDATQRNMLALREVEYIISAELRLSELGRRAEETLVKYTEEMRRRVEAGKCFHRPSLGVREFAADFAWAESVADFAPQQEWNETLGLMLYDVFSHEERAVGFKFLDGEDYADNQMPLFAHNAPRKKGKAGTDGLLVKPAAAFFRAEIKDSVLDCHPDRVVIMHHKGGAR